MGAGGGVVAVIHFRVEGRAGGWWRVGGRNSNEVGRTCGGMRGSREDAGTRGTRTTWAKQAGHISPIKRVRKSYKYITERI